MEFRSVLAFFTWRNKWRNQQTHLCNFLSRTHSNTHTVNVHCCWLLLTERRSALYVKHLITQHIYCTNCTVCNWTVLIVITHKLLLHVQLHNNTAHLLYKYCTNCTVCNWTVLTVITHKLLLHVQLHNSTAHLLYKYCTNCTVYNWTVLTVITQKLLLHVQLHKNRETAKLITSELECSRLFDIVCIYR
jgi:Pyruvate/2-oxoacid:ferredoxin oxidoreductase delta subunit